MLDRNEVAERISAMSDDEIETYLDVLALEHDAEFGWHGPKENRTHIFEFLGQIATSTKGFADAARKWADTVKEMA